MIGLVSISWFVFSFCYQCEVIGVVNTITTLNVLACVQALEVLHANRNINTDLLMQPYARPTAKRF